MFFKAISAAQRAQKNIVTTVLLFLHKNPSFWLSGSSKSRLMVLALFLEYFLFLLKTQNQVLYDPE